MSLEFIEFILGPFENNSYLVGDAVSKNAVVIDPSFNSEEIIREALKKNYKISAIWLTHAHFDHFAGVETLVKAYSPPLPVRIHPKDIDLYKNSGGAASFGVSLEIADSPIQEFLDHEELLIGKQKVEVRHTPGHTPGHVVFYFPNEHTLICGDLIFFRSVGRTDLPGGNFDQLIDSINREVLSLPDNTRILSGHGIETTVGKERNTNPFLR